ncbi:MAG: preprotein translocase subunit SecE [Solirubrobacteraceae bacterium]
MARDRKRARQRRSRPLREGAATPSQNGPVRADLPGALSHAGDADEFDAALIRGAGGVPVEQQVEPHQNGEGSGDASSAELVSAGSGRGGRRGGGDPSVELAFGEEAAPEGALPARQADRPVHNRAIAFLRASWAELQRMQWPDRRQVTQATTVVLGFVAVAGVYLGAADWAAQKIVNFIL